MVALVALGALIADDDADDDDEEEEEEEKALDPMTLTTDDHRLLWCFMPVPSFQDVIMESWGNTWSHICHDWWYLEHYNHVNPFNQSHPTNPTY